MIQTVQITRAWEIAREGQATIHILTTFNGSTWAAQVMGQHLATR